MHLQVALHVYIVGCRTIFLITHLKNSFEFTLDIKLRPILHHCFSQTHQGALVLLMTLGTNKYISTITIIFHNYIDIFIVITVM